MITTTNGAKAVWGVTKTLPLNGFPNGKYKIRMRPHEFTVVYIKTDTSIRRFYITENDAKWIPFHEIGANHRGYIANYEDNYPHVIDS